MLPSLSDVCEFSAMKINEKLEDNLSNCITPIWTNNRRMKTQNDFAFGNSFIQKHICNEVKQNYKKMVLF